MATDIRIEDVKIDSRRVRRVILNRDTKRNALSLDLMDDATKAIEDVPDHVVLISSIGRSFSAGLDRNDLYKDTAKVLGRLEGLYFAIMNHPSAVACLIQQKAIAGGVGLALCSDVTVMTCNAWFSLPGQAQYQPLAEVLFPIVQGTRRVSRAKFDGWYNKPATANELLADGFIDSIVHHHPRDPCEPPVDMVDDLERAAVDVLRKRGWFHEKREGRSWLEPPEGEPSVQVKFKLRRERAIEVAETDAWRHKLKLQGDLPDVQNPQKKVFVVYGRNKQHYDKLRAALIGFELQPLEWALLEEAAGGGSPYVGNVIATGLKMAQAAVVLIDGDDDGRLREGLRLPQDPSDVEEMRPQARQNVILEAGMSLAECEHRTIMVLGSHVRLPSDLEGRTFVRLADPDWKAELLRKLRFAQCEVRPDAGEIGVLAAVAAKFLRTRGASGSGSRDYCATVYGVERDYTIERLRGGELVARCETRTYVLDVASITDGVAFSMSVDGERHHLVVDGEGEDDEGEATYVQCLGARIAVEVVDEGGHTI